jgi:hypothetical protein
MKESIDRRLTKLENSKLGARAIWGDWEGFCPPSIIVHEGEDENQIIKELEERGDIPPVGTLPPGQIRVIVCRIVSPRWARRDVRE